ncbi:MAG: C40 family peptidase [Ruminococcus sp.]|nr:C40 family peptidase [Ruminococcus sp.]
MSVVSKAVDYIKKIANDQKHGYSQTNRWGSPDTWSDYDCSSLVISAYEAAGVKVKTAGATYTGNMYSVFTKCGFKDMTSKINLSTGSGLIAGDVLLNHTDHTAMMISKTQLAEASIDENGGISGGRVGDQTGQEIHIRSYYNYPWNCVLRYPVVKTLPTLDKTGYKKGQKTIGVLALKQLLLLAKAKGLITAKLNNDNNFGKGTQKAVNELLKKWGYKQNGIAGKRFIKKLGGQLGLKK